MQNKELKRLNVMMPKHLHDHFKKKCIDKNAKMSEVIIEMVRIYVGKT